jgi:hypothetical protein
MQIRQLPLRWRGRDPAEAKDAPWGDERQVAVWGQLDYCRADDYRLCARVRNRHAVPRGLAAAAGAARARGTRRRHSRCARPDALAVLAGGPRRGRLL